MSYTTGKPDPIEIDACHVYTDYGCSSNPDGFHYVRCYHRGCSECRDDPDLYRACPICGAKLNHIASFRDRCRCVCGTVIWTCRPLGSIVVAGYAVDALVTNKEEDTI